MFRRRRRRSRKRITSSIMHVPSTMNNNVASLASITFFAAVPANYTITGSDLSNDTFEQADRLQLVPIGNTINSIIFNISIRDITLSGVIEYAIFKVERASETPTEASNLLPSNTEISTQGLQSGMRQYQPGRVIKYGQLAVAAEQPRTLSIKGNYAKFKMAKLRTGDHYGIMLYNRTSATAVIDIQCRYNASI